MQPRLDRKLCLLKRTVQRDAAGNAYETWAEIGDLWAGRDRVTANDQMLALQMRGKQVDRLHIRFMQCLEDESALAEYRVRFNGRDYELISCVENLRHERRQWMLLTIGYIQGQPTLTTADVPPAV